MGNEPQREFSLDSDRGGGSVTCVRTADIGESGKPDIIVGRDDGYECLSIRCSLYRQHTYC